MNDRLHPDIASEPLRYERDARGVITLTLNRAQAFNALSESMLAALQAAMERVATDDSARVVVIAEAAQRAILPTLPKSVAQVTVAARYLSAAKDAFVGGDPTQYQIAPESKSAMEINQTPVVSAFEEAKIPEVAAPQKAPNTYEDLVNQE